jgi:hypothetical protein
MKSVVIGGYNPEFSSVSVLYAAGFDTGWFPLHDEDPVDLDQNGKEDYYLTSASFPCWLQNLENKRFKF